MLASMIADNRMAPTISNIETQINVLDDRWIRRFNLEQVSSAVFSMAAKSTIGSTSCNYEISVLFCDDNRMSELNARWRGINKPTNVLSFPAAVNEIIHGHRILGDIAIAFETCRVEAESYNIDFENHVKHMLVHGFLHLLGYDHETEEDANKMEALEVAILSGLKIQNPYCQLIPDQENRRDDG